MSNGGSLWRMELVQQDFSWNRLDDASIEAFSRACYYEGPDDPEARRNWLLQKWRSPTREFVSQARYAIENVWLRRQPAVARSIVDALLRHGIGPRERPQSPADCLRFLVQCSGRSTTQKFYREALLRFGSQTPRQDEPLELLIGESIPSVALLKPHEQVPDSRRAYPYQEKAWDALTEHLAEAQSSGVFEGLLVMPTGSGKTFTAAHWLTEQVLNRGQRILWLAHRYELLEQAAQAFHRCASLAHRCNQLKVRIVSGAHCSTSSIGPDDDILLCSVASLSRRLDIASEILADQRRFLVVDEAHHAASPSYRRIIELTKQQPTRRLLGLTATPTRTLASEQPILGRLFGNRKIFELSTRELIEQRFLARPIPVHVRTRTQVEQAATQEDFRHLERFTELSEAWLDRIAHINGRNEEITRHYLEHRAKYGKTLVFAINIAHAVLLCERLREAGVEVDYVASHRPSGEAIDQREIVERFRRPNSGLNILVNVMILTEGVDIPGVQTVFMTRPTRSEILIRQMVGRALRGPAAGGTEIAYLVSFEDHWQEFEEWEKPLDLVQDLLVQDEAPQQSEEDSAATRLAEVIPWELIRSTANEMRRLQRLGDVESFEAIPYGWYLLEFESEGEIIRQIVPVYEHQQSCWKAYLDSLHKGAAEADASIESTYLEYFGDCDVPRASRHYVAAIRDYVVATGASPPLEQFHERSNIDPRTIAGEIWQAQLGPIEITRLIRQRHETPLGQAIYPTREELKEAVQRALDALAEPENSRQPQLGRVQFEPWSDVPLRPGPHHRLPELWLGMLQVAGRLLPELAQPNVEVDWTRRVIRGWYAKALWEPESPLGTGQIKMNCLLDSPDVSPETIRFLMWHEFLHLYLQQGHSPRFRALERKWPGMQAADRELETLRERFDIHWW